MNASSAAAAILALLACTAPPAPLRAEPSAPTVEGAVRITLEGMVTSRLQLEAAPIPRVPIRAVAIADSRLLLVREELAPAGYTRERMRPANPIEETRLRGAVALGASCIGSLAPRGRYRRMLDPTTGGAFPASLAEADRIVPDTALAGAIRHEGFFIAAGRTPRRMRVLHLSPAVWHLAREDDFSMSGVDLALHLGALRLSLLAARLRSREVTGARPADEGWYYELPPLGPLRHVQGVSLAIGRPISFTRAPVRIGAGSGDGLAGSLLAEGWRQSGGSAPGSAAGSVVLTARAGPVRAAMRAAGATPGYRAADGGVPARGTLLAGRMELAPSATTLRVRPTLRLTANRRTGAAPPRPGCATHERAGALLLELHEARRVHAELGASARRRCAGTATRSAHGALSLAAATERRSHLERWRLTAEAVIEQHGAGRIGARALWRPLAAGATPGAIGVSGGVALHRSQAPAVGRLASSLTVDLRPQQRTAISLRATLDTALGAGQRRGGADAAAGGALTARYRW